MKRFLSIWAASVCLVACAGDPPAWWNPGNRYGQAGQSTTQSTAPAQRVQKPAEPVVSEVALDPLPDNSYEEETISPLPEEEDMPAATPVTEPALDETLPAPSILE